MKWREPWLNSLKRQPAPNLFARPNLIAAAAWACGVLVLLSTAVLSGTTSLQDAASRLWMVPVFGIGMASILSYAHWLSPLEVTSGPRGIVVSKSESLGLIHWESIRSYKFVQIGNERRLELTVNYSQEPEIIYLSAKAKEEEIAKELNSHISAEA
jgi:hypothetical protein